MLQDRAARGMKFVDSGKKGTRPPPMNWAGFVLPGDWR
jgi:hypothetical protein